MPKTEAQVLELETGSRIMIDGLWFTLTAPAQMNVKEKVPGSMDSWSDEAEKQSTCDACGMPYDE